MSAANNAATTQTTPATKSRVPNSSPKLLIVVGLLVAFLASGYVVLWSVADSWFYNPNQQVYSAGEEFDVQPKDVTFHAPNGPQLHGWWLAPHGKHRGTVVYCHGNAANLTLHARYAEWMPKQGFAVLVFDYRGYGKSEGSPTRDGTIADALAAVDYALARDPNRTIVFGHSLGGAIAIVAGAQRQAVRAVVAESTFPSYRAIAAASAPALDILVPLFVSEGQDPITYLPVLTPRPLLVIHGEDDHIVPVALGKKLFEAASEPKQLWIVPGSRHFTPWLHVPEEFERRVDAFFTKALARK
ncbi:MAG: fermentation-respiration switch protein FrsA (DUF1100 family) [Planctomycetota bacterium]|jgi:fermentation-respiration switch protein FrsA (DUF1100 family)